MPAAVVVAFSLLPLFLARSSSSSPLQTKDVCSAVVEEEEEGAPLPLRNFDVSLLLLLGGLWFAETAAVVVEVAAAAGEVVVVCCGIGISFGWMVGVAVYKECK